MQTTFRSETETHLLRKAEHVGSQTHEWNLPKHQTEYWMDFNEQTENT